MDWLKRNRAADRSKQSAGEVATSSKTSEPGSGGAVPAPLFQDKQLFDLRRLFRELWRWKLIVILAMLIGAAKGISDAHDFPSSYEAQMTVALKAEQGLGVSTTGGAALLGAARSLGFSGVGGVKSSSLDYFKQVLGSRGFADVLQVKHGLLQKAFKGSWDDANGTWIKPVVDENSFRQRIRRFFHLNSTRVPDNGSLARYIGGIIKVKSHLKSPFYKISVTHRDRDFSLFLLRTVYSEADEYLAARSRNEQARNKRYIQMQLRKNNLKEVRDALLSILMNLEQKSMLANSEQPYMFKVLESPWVADQPNEPQLVMIIGKPVGVAAILSLIVITLFVSFRFE